MPTISILQASAPSNSIFSFEFDSSSTLEGLSSTLRLKLAKYLPYLLTVAITCIFAFTFSVAISFNSSSNLKRSTMQTKRNGNQTGRYAISVKARFLGAKAIPQKPKNVVNLAGANVSNELTVPAASTKPSCACVRPQIQATTGICSRLETESGGSIPTDSGAPEILPPSI